VSAAKERGAEIVMCASTGNTSASPPLMPPAQNEMCRLLPNGKIALGKLARP